MGISPGAQWLGLHTFTAMGLSSIPSWGTKDPTSCVVWTKNKQNKTLKRLLLPGKKKNRVLKKKIDLSTYLSIRWVVLSRVQLFVTPWTLAHQAPLFMEFSRHE